MKLDDELLVIGKLKRILDGLKPDARRRALAYLNDRQAEASKPPAGESDILPEGLFPAARSA